MPVAAPRDPTRRRLLLAGGAVVCAGCAAAPPDAVRLAGPGVLFGEVHDQPAGHALRLAAFDDWLARGARPALAMEMFDRSDQPAIDRLRGDARDAGTLVRGVLAARPGPPARGGWDWRFYEPFVARALLHDLPLVAANVGRAEARRVMREGLAAHGFDAAVPPDILAAHSAQIVASHCGHVDEALAARMAWSQAARDQQMAQAVAAHVARGVLLLAGNGHVRTDVGVPRWLPPAVRARCEAIGVLEDGDDTRAFDRVLHLPAVARPDPCAAMRPPRGLTA